jgi:hypothetical protein
MGLQPLYGKGPHALLWAGSWVICAKITVSGIPNCLNYCKIFIVHMQFTNASAGCGLDTYVLDCIFLLY